MPRTRCDGQTDRRTDSTGRNPLHPLTVPLSMVFKVLHLKPSVVNVPQVRICRKPSVVMKIVVKNSRKSLINHNVTDKLFLKANGG